MYPARFGEGRKPLPIEVAYFTGAEALQAYEEISEAGIENWLDSLELLPNKKVNIVDYEKHGDFGVIHGVNSLQIVKLISNVAHI